MRAAHYEIRRPLFGVLDHELSGYAPHRLQELCFDSQSILARDDLSVCQERCSRLPHCLSDSVVRAAVDLWHYRQELIDDVDHANLCAALLLRELTRLAQASLCCVAAICGHQDSFVHGRPRGLL